jgi:hypothetical protein
MVRMNTYPIRLSGYRCDLIIAVPIVIVLLLSGAARAVAFNEERAMANVAADYSACAAFYSLGSACIARTQFGPNTTAEQLESLSTFKAGQEALRQSLMVMRPDVAAARFKLFFDDMSERTGNDCGNLAPLLIEYRFCKQLLEEGPAQRMEYWRAQR